MGLNPGAKARFSELPFRHLVVDNVFTAVFYADLVREFERKLGRGLSDKDANDRFSRFPHYDAYHMTVSPRETGEPSHFLFSREWKEYINRFFGLELDDNTLVEAHHHLVGSSDGYVHNDYHVANFVHDPLPNGMNAWYFQCAYRGQGHGTIHAVRSIALILFLDNPDWKEGDGGETALFTMENGESREAARVAPVNNRLLAFEISPRSFHAFRQNRRSIRNSLTQWFHSPTAFATARYGEEADLCASARRNVLLTGAAGLLGTAFTERFAKQFNIVGVGRNAPPGPVGYDFIEGDIVADPEAIVDEALRRMGSVDLLVNNAVAYDYKPLVDVTRDEFVSQFLTNVYAPLELSRILLERFWGTRKDENLRLNRNIVNISSTASMQYYGGHKAVYGATKAALNALSVHMAAEFHPLGVRVNVVVPNSFPLIVDTSSVLTAIATFDNSSRNGDLEVIDR